MQEEILKQVTVGSKLPDVDFEYYQGNRFIKTNLKSYRDKWLVLFFYPADFTFVCPTELEDMANNYPEFQKNNTEVISFSTDTVFVHKAWHDHSKSINMVNFPMGSDPTGKIAKELGIYLQDEGITLRATFVIDPNGIIKAMEVNDNSIGRNADELLRRVLAAQYVYTHNGEVCPAKWQPGKNTLKPGVDLVGKI